MFDMGPYYLTTMVSLLGSVRRVTGSARVSFPERLITSKPKHGQPIKVNTPTHIAGVLDFAGGAVGTLVTSFDVHATTVPSIEIYGSEGTLLVPDPNTYEGPVMLRRPGEKTFTEVPLEFPNTDNCRGMGVADMALAIRDGRPHRASGELAYHVLDLMAAFHDASLEEHHVQVASTTARPAAFPLGLGRGADRREELGQEIDPPRPHAARRGRLSRWARVTGRRKRRGPAAPGLRYSTPAVFLRCAGWCECPLITTRIPAAALVSRSRS